MRQLFSQVFHKIPNFRGRSRALKMINRLFLKMGLDPFVMAQLQGGYRLKVDLRSGTEFLAYYTGQYDSDQIEKITALFKKDWIVLDVGANIGFYSVPFGLKLRSLGGRLYSFEPVDSNRSRLLENIRLSNLDGTVNILATGLSDRAGTARITLREDFQSGATTGNAAIVIEDGKDNIFEMQTIHLITLDEFAIAENLSRLDFIKVDIEGHEDMFLAGGRSAIARFRPIILAEMNEDYFRRRQVDVDLRLREVLSALDYTWVGKISPNTWGEISTLKGKRNDEDVLLVPQEKLEQTLRFMNS